MGDLLDSYDPGDSWDEMFDATGRVRPPYEALPETLRSLSSQGGDSKERWVLAGAEPTPSDEVVASYRFGAQRPFDVRRPDRGPAGGSTSQQQQQQQQQQQRC